MDIPPNPPKKNDSETSAEYAKRYADWEKGLITSEGEPTPKGTQEWLKNIRLKNWAESSERGN